MRPNRPILVVENEDDDVLLLTRAFKLAGITNPVQVVNSGEDAIAYLGGEGRFADRRRYPVPALVLLDLKLRGLDGADVLKWIRRQPAYRTLPVIILSSSFLTPDVAEAYRSGANSYIVKVADPAEWVEIARDFARWWLNRNVDPP